MKTWLTYFSQAPFFSLLALSLAVPAHAASFDCGTHHQPDERAVCGSSTLSSLDEQLAGVYYQALVKEHGRESFRDTQRAFLKRRRACGADETCLEDVYRERISELGGGSPSVAGSESEPVDDEAENQLWFSARQSNSVEAFNEYLSKYPNGEFSYSARARIEALEN